MSDLVDVWVSEGGEVHVRTWAARTDALAAELATVFARPDVAAARHVRLTAVTPAGASPDAGWLFALATAQAREQLSVSARVITYSPPIGAAQFYSDASFATYRGTFAGVQRVFLRDWRVAWESPRWPDVTMLTLAPLHAETAFPCAWISEALADLDAWPQLHTLRLHRPICEALLPQLVDSPMLGRLRVLDMHDVLTNRGAQIIHAHADRFSALERIYIGAEPYRPLSLGTTLQRGERDIDDAWRSRLRDKLGKRLRFDRPR